jgi:hypothetical protein
MSYDTVGISLNYNDTLYYDLNGDSIDDIYVIHDWFSSMMAYTYSYKIGTLPNTSIRLTSPARQPLEAIYGEQLNWSCSWISGTKTLRYGSSYGDSYSAVPTNAPFYMGLRIETSSGSTFGWIRLNVSNGFQVLDYAVSETLSQIPGNTTTNKKIAVFPNPADDYLTLSFPEPANDNTQITIMDISGKTVYSNLNNSPENNLSISVAHLPEGLYLLSTRTNNQVYNTKFIVRY